MANMRTVGVRLRMDTGSYARDVDKATAANRKLKGSLDDIANKVGIVGGALVVGAGVAVAAAAKFDKAMSEVGAVAGATADEMERLRQAAIDAGRETAFSASEAAKAEAELAKAGIATSDILSGALAGSLSLASAGQIDLAQSAEIAAAAMNTFGLKGSDVEHVADVLAAAANKSAAGVEDLGMGLQQVGLVAAQVGLTFEETVALLAAMADRGLKGSDAATSLKTALMRLAAPTDGAAEAMEALGISLYDSNGNMVDAATIAGQLEKSMKTLAPAERNAALQTIFGSDAIRAANILYEEGEAGIRDYIAAVDDQGASSRMAAAKLDNLAGDVEKLTGSLETLFIQSGSGASGGLRLLVQTGDELVTTFGALPGPVQSGAVVLAGLTGAGLLTLAAMLKLKSSIADMVENLTAMGPAGQRAGRSLGTIAAVGGRAVGIIAGLATASALADAAISDLNPQVDALAKGLATLPEGGNAAGETARLFGEDLEKLDLALRNATSSGKGFATGMEGWIPFASSADSSWTKNVERINALDQALASLVQQGKGAEAARVFEYLRTRAGDLGISIDALKAAFPAYQGALETATDATSSQAIEAGRATTNNLLLAGAFGEAANEADGLKASFDRLNGATLTWRDAHRDAEAAVDDLTEALQESNGSLDETDPKGRAAAAAVDQLAMSAAAAAQAKYDETQSVEEANKVYQSYVEQLRQTLLNANVAGEEVDALVASITKMPTYKAVTIDVVETHQSYWRDYRAGERRWGGLTEHAAAGALRSAHIAMPPTRYAYAEPETGGEAFVPRKGNYGRSMSILSAAAGWYGADVVPRGAGYGGMGGAGGMEVTVSVRPGADRGVMSEISKALIVEVARVGAGDAQTYFGQRR